MASDDRVTRRLGRAQSQRLAHWAKQNERCGDASGRGGHARRVDDLNIAGLGAFRRGYLPVTSKRST